MLRKTTLAAFLAMLLAPVWVPVHAEAKPSGVVVQAGAIDPVNPDGPFEYTRFYPDTIRVHSGQTVRWNVLGFHTVTFSKSGRAGFFRRDELPGTYAIPEQTIFGTNCGRGGHPCVVNRQTTFAGSAAPLFDESPVDVRLDLPPGRYTFFCEIHAQMKGTVEVVRRGIALPTQRDVDRQIKAQVRVDSMAINRLLKSAQVPASKIDANGARTWRVLLGLATPDNHVEAIGYFPSTLNISQGDRVHYEFGRGSLADPHTVTFPAQLAGIGEDPIPAPHSLSGLGIYLSCDFDGPTSGLPGVPGTWGAIGPACPGTLEAVWAPWMISPNRAPGDAVLTPATYHDSAYLIGPTNPRNFRASPDGRAFGWTFDASFPAPGAFAFECDIHGPFMTGSVTVT